MFLSEKRLAEIFDKVSQLKIAVIGDVMLDKYLWGEADRISPEAPVPIVDLKKEEIRIGGAANVADNLSVLGAEPLLISLIGNDIAGEQFKAHSAELGLPIDLLVVSDKRPTTVKTRIIARNQQVCRIDSELAVEMSPAVYKKLAERLDSVASEVDAVIISDYGKGVITSDFVSRIVNLCRNSGSIVTVDPKEHHWKYYKDVDLIKPNDNETSHATGIATDTEFNLENAGWKLLEMTSAKAALITTGERGMSIFKPGERVEHLKTMAQDVFDVTGAGDTVIAVATTALAAGANLIEAAIIANHAAGVVVGEVGTAAVNLEGIANSMVREKTVQKTNG
ncbi:D-glycero-beta-D-manno-heptose-7-phosphate kinase [bacterium]|nr:D-glycero-beta-D-manno-heptose-7-phosphate kinase [bacterium]